MPNVAVRGLEIHYDRAGAGAPLLLISGTNADLRNTPVHPNPLTAAFDVVAYDQRGLGQTSKPDQPYSMADYAEDAAGLLDALDIDRAHVVGVSFGGMVAQHLAIRRPDLVDRLVLACTSPGGPDHASADLLALAQLDPPDRLATYLPLLDTRCVDAMMPAGLDRVLTMLASGRTAETDEELMGARRQLEARADHDVCADLGRIDAPTLVIGGRYDGVAAPANLEALLERIDGAELKLCEGGHFFLMQDAAAWPAIIDFLDDPSR